MSGDRGMTVVEVVIALAILTVGVLAAAGLQASALRASAVAEEMQQINTEARSQLEARRGMTLVATSPTVIACAQEKLRCEIEVRPCAVVGSDLACDFGAVTDPAAYAVIVTVSGTWRELTLRTVAMR